MSFCLSVTVARADPTGKAEYVMTVDTVLLNALERLREFQCSPQDSARDLILLNYRFVDCLTKVELQELARRSRILTSECGYEEFATLQRETISEIALVFSDFDDSGKVWQSDFMWRVAMSSPFD